MSTSRSLQGSCKACSKSKSELDHPLKNCAKCKRITYCSRECQKADWKNHKTTCGVVEGTDGAPPTEFDLSELAPVVTAFNSLSRSEEVRLRRDEMDRNHWHFSIRTVPSQPPMHVLYIINPSARLPYVENFDAPADLFQSLTAEGRAGLILPLLMTAFIKGMRNANDNKAFAVGAPWTWGTNDTELAREMEIQLKEMGVREELHHVAVGGEEDDRIADEEWANFIINVRRRMGLA